METVDTVGFLLGTWRLSRSIEDHRSATRGAFTGTARLTDGASAGGAVRPAGRTTRLAHYEEEGELRFGSYRGAARRELGYERLESGAAMVYFADGRPFVDLDLTAGTWRSGHRCGEDDYEIVTVVRSPTMVEERWRVRGPEKDYDAVTTLARLD